MTLLMLCRPPNVQFFRFEVATRNSAKQALDDVVPVDDRIRARAAVLAEPVEGGTHR